MLPRCDWPSTTGWSTASPCVPASMVLPGYHDPEACRPIGDEPCGSVSARLAARLHHFSEFRVRIRKTEPMSAALESLQAGVRVDGVLPDGPVEVVQVSWHGTAA